MYHDEMPMIEHQFTLYLQVNRRGQPASACGLTHPQLFITNLSIRLATIGKQAREVQRKSA